MCRRCDPGVWQVAGSRPAAHMALRRPGARRPPTRRAHPWDVIMAVALPCLPAGPGCWVPRRPAVRSRWTGRSSAAWPRTPVEHHVKSTLSRGPDISSGSGRPVYASRIAQDRLVSNATSPPGGTPGSPSLGIRARPDAPGLSHLRSGGGGGRRRSRRGIAWPRGPPLSGAGRGAVPRTRPRWPRASRSSRWWRAGASPGDGFLWPLS